jgi:predicted O-methyltransferase YrrM
MTQVINVNPVPNDRLELLRSELMTAGRKIQVSDRGTGARTLPAERRIADIARRSLSPARFSCLYQRLINRFKCGVVIELGTSLGINTMYLAQPPHAKVFTFEGAPAIAAIAHKNFERMGMKNITLIEGDIAEALPSFVSRQPRIDLAFMDANHTSDATRMYFGQILNALHDGSIVIVDDIHLSKEMENAWAWVRDQERVSVTIDLYRCGIVFFTPLLDKQHVVLKA